MDYLANFIISNHAYFMLLILCSLIVATFGKRISNTKQDWECFSWNDKYGHWSSGGVAMIYMLLFPVVVPAFDTPVANSLHVIIFLSIVLVSIVFLTIGILLCYVGPLALREKGKSWR